MNSNVSEVEKLILERKSLPDCPRRRLLDQKIEEIKKKTKKSFDGKPLVLVKYASRVVGSLKYNDDESSWFFHCDDGSVFEVGFKYEDAKNWAAVNGYQLKVSHET
jgi:hypothetical protein